MAEVQNTNVKVNNQNQNQPRKDVTPYSEATMNVEIYASKVGEILTKVDHTYDSKHEQVSLELAKFEEAIASGDAKATDNAYHEYVNTAQPVYNLIYNNIAKQISSLKQSGADLKELQSSFIKSLFANIDTNYAKFVESLGIFNDKVASIEQSQEAISQLKYKVKTETGASLIFKKVNNTMHSLVNDLKKLAESVYDIVELKA